MGQTVVPFGDPKAQKKWSGQLFVETTKKSYWEKFIGNNENSVIQRKTELESDAGDRISFDLSVQLRGGVTKGDDRLKGNEEALRFYTDEVIIDQMRKSVSAGGKMTRKRTSHDLRRVAKDSSKPPSKNWRVAKRPYFCGENRARVKKSLPSLFMI